MLLRVGKLIFLGKSGICLENDLMNKRAEWKYRSTTLKPARLNTLGVLSRLLMTGWTDVTGCDRLMLKCVFSWNLYGN